MLTFSAYADAVITEFSAEPSRDKITLKWKTAEEENINLFFVERSTNNKDFSKIGEVVARGSNSEYEYVDDNLSDVKTIYYYRLRIRSNEGRFQISESISVIPNISSFIKTWGSIKALFQWIFLRDTPNFPAS